MHRRTESDGEKSLLWYCSVSTPHEGRIRVPLHRDKTVAEEMERKIKILEKSREAGWAPPPEVASWAANCRKNTRQALTRAKLIPEVVAFSAEALDSMLDDWERARIARGNGAAFTTRRKRAMSECFKACSMFTVSQLDPEPLQRYVRERMSAEDAPWSSKTGAHVVSYLKGFSKWLVDCGRTSEDTLRRMTKPRVTQNKRRRALTPEEAARLIRITLISKPRRNMDGPARALLYATALETGLRAGELHALRAGWCRVDENPPSLFIPAESTKSKREANPYVRERLAAQIADHIEGMDPEDQVFPFDLTKASDMIKKDLTAAGIPIADREGRTLDFHALRHTFSTWCAQTGANPKTVMDMNRHTDIRLTLETYTHVYRESEREVLNKIPDVTTGVVAGGAPTGAQNHQTIPSIPKYYGVEDCG